MSNTDSMTYRFMVDAAYAKSRLDKFLSEMQEDLSRARVQALIKEGCVQVNGRACLQSSAKVAEGDDVVIDVPPPRNAEPQAEDIALDIVYEDEHMLVLNKKAGLVVHPGAGNYEGTLVNALLHHCGDSLSGIGGVLRPGIVHRLDKETSGLMLVAKSDKAHKGLAAQLEDRSLSRTYYALVLGVPVPRAGKVDMPIARHVSNRLKMNVVKKGGKEARTGYKVLNVYRDVLSLVECKLETGRTHQIRVHMQAIKYPIVGDALYGPQKNALESALKRGGYDGAVIREVSSFPRQALHAGCIEFIHPISGEEMGFEVDLPDDMAQLVCALNN